jgi:hypothetical protein
VRGGIEAVGAGRSPAVVYRYRALPCDPQPQRPTRTWYGGHTHPSLSPRSFEYTGEDPFLASQMVSAEVVGIQSQNVSGCVKHFVFNAIEDDRSGMSSNVPNRAAKELYYRPFQAAVDAGVGSAMCS